MDEATRAQVRAADPGRSTWLTANAGSGKTRVLTDRVARLLLAGCAPERILCLTYTKAAATEMQNRLLRRLGEWAMLPEAALRAQLAELGEADAPDLPAARRLFARAIETPGGLKVQTIHSFCAGVLRRFPLEAGVPHGFSELDDRSAALIRAEVIEDMAREGAPELADLLALHSGDRIDGFLAGLRGFDDPPDPKEIWRESGLEPGMSWQRLIRDVLPGGTAEVITAIIPHLAASGTNDGRAATRLVQGDWDMPGMAELEILETVLLTGSGAKTPFAAKIGGFPTKKLQSGACAPFMEELDALMERVEQARPLRLALRHAEQTLALRRFGHAFMQRYEAEKRRKGWLDFDDLITRTAALLSESSMAQWVLFRLDGGIDHILVDEAQDTSPGQWQVIQRLTDEFTAGMGARDDPRTLFVVGDPKQSIYSFQGADIAVFEERRMGFAEAFQAVGRPMQVLDLRHSFRSSSAILSVVDAVFANDAARGLGDPPRHIAFRENLPGRVDLWPPVPAPETPEAGDWTDPVDLPAENSETTVLARAIARQIAAMLGRPISDARTGKTRVIRPGDVLILVQRRAALFAEVIGALKAAGLPVAGADRLKLVAELAVRDIRSTLAVAATPEDDLALAEALRSPLFGMSEQDLYHLAAGRGQGRHKPFLWQRLRDSRHLEAVEILSDLMAQTGFMRPYDLISRLLIRHGGRDRLIARLGPEAEDGIDELLSQALVYETSGAPSLTGFLVWLTGDDVEVRRQPGSASEGEGLIRVMTVHGSKGLESPIVIIPDTARRRPPQEGQVLAPPNGAPLWRGRKEERPEHVAELAEKQTERQMLERKRLLYVGLTRAKTWLIVAAAGETGTGEESWHALVADGFARAGQDLTESRIPADWGGEILRLSHGDWPATAPKAATVMRPMVTLPGWIAEHAPHPAHPPQPVAATALGGAKVIGMPAPDADPVAAMLFGTRLHLLLEHLPGRAPADWPRLARDLLADAEGGLPDEQVMAALLEEAGAVIQAPELASVFDLPDGAQVLPEVALSAPLPGVGILLSGAIDRLIVTPERVTAVDYKSNTEIPARPEQVPPGILRQMAAYRAALMQIYPGREIGAAIVWTRARRLMALPDKLLDQAIAGLDPAQSGA